MYSYVVRGGFLDGADGFRFCVMRAMYQEMIAIYKFDARKKGRR
jgi:hypothetical protein